MTEFQFTSHAEKRMRQRGVRYEDVMQTIENAGEPKLLGGGLLSYSVNRCHKAVSDSLQRLVVVLDPAGATIVTVLKVGVGKRNSYVGNFKRYA